MLYIALGRALWASPHACLDGYVYLGYVVEEDGEEVERVEALPCRRGAEDK